jgi:integrase
MKGHTAQRGKTWTYWIDVGRDENGRRRQVTKGGFKTEREAQAAMRKLLVTIEEGSSYKKPSKETLAAFMREWLNSAKARIQPTTWSTYTTFTAAYIIPALGTVQLQRLNTAQLNAFYGTLLENGRRRGPSGGLSPASVGRIHGLLRRALGDALKWERVSRNVAVGATPPRKQRQTLKVWSAAETADFLTSDPVREDRLYAAYLLALTTGLRRGELLGLAWRDVDLGAGWLNVRQTVVLVNSKATFSTPKTAAGRRSVALDPRSIASLSEHRLRQVHEREQLGLAPNPKPDDLVFSEIDEDHLAVVHPGRFAAMFDRRVKAAGVPRIRLHDTRHTFATLALAAGVNPKVVSERLGHASVSITLDLYSHTVPSLQTEAAAKVADLIFESSVSSR